MPLFTLHNETLNRKCRDKIFLSVLSFMHIVAKKQWGLLKTLQRGYLRPLKVR
jgi:hypothetical protein